MISSKIIGGGMFLVLCLVSASMAQNGLQEMQPLDDQKLMKEVKDLLQGIQSSLDENNEIADDPDPNIACRCGGSQCSCCKLIRIRIKTWKLDKMCCLSIKYLSENARIRVKFNFGSRTLFSRDISLRNPKPVCFKLGIKSCKACIEFSDLSTSGGRISGCATLKVKLLFVTILKVKLGCFKIKYRDEVETGNALEQLPYYEDDPNWIEAAQQDVPVPVYEDYYEVAMESVDRPLQDEEFI